jgi:Tol biopolymer transport system component
VLGTLPYMAPEQLEGKEADARTDLWALGAILYEMVTGARAFAGDSSVSLIGEIMHAEPPALAARQPLTPPALERLVKRCLAKHPDQRWDSAHDVGDELRWIAQTSGTNGLAAAPVPSRGRWRTFVAAGLAVIGAGTVGWLGWTLRGRAVKVPTSSTVRFTVPNVDVVPAAWSPDGRHLALVMREGGRTQLAVRTLDAVAPRVLPNTDGAALPFWSPDGEWIGFFQRGALWRIAVATGGVELICRMRNFSGGSWGTAGEIVAANTWDLWRVPATGGTPKQLNAGSGTFSFPSFLGDGRRFVVAHHTASPSTIDVMSIDGEAPRTLVKGYDAEVVGDSLVYQQDAGLFRQQFDVTTATLRGAPVRLDAGREAQGGLTGFALSSDGTLVYQRQAVSELRWFDRTGREGDALPLHPSCRNPELSPDGSRVAVECDAPKTSSPGALRNRDVWTFDLARKTASRLMADEGRDESDPTWSPDGTRVVFASQDPKLPGTILFSTNPSGGGTPERLFESPFFLWPTSWWPGRYLVTYNERSTNEQSTGPGAQRGDLYLLDRESQLRPLATSPFSEMEGQLTPDAKYLLYTSNETGDHEVYVKAVDDAAGKWRVSTGGGYKPRWRPDASEIFYLTGDRTLMAVPVSWTRGFQPGQPTPLFKTRTVDWLGPGLRYLYAVARGGQRFLMWVGEPTSSLTVVVNATGEHVDGTPAPPLMKGK